MLEQLKYKNHLNEVFDFGKDGIFVNVNELHDYEWTVTKKGNRIAALDYSVSKRKLPIVIICDTDEKGIDTKNKLMEIVEKDVLAMKHGKIIIGDYYFKCFVTKSQKKDYLKSKRYMNVTLTLTSDFPYWVKETTCSFNKLGEFVGSGENLDYDYDYPYDYFSGMGNVKLHNTGFVGTNFRMIFYGACSDPTVYIQGHKYQVNCDIGENEYLVIDSINKTIMLTSNDGTVTNMFNSRNKEDYIFEKIPAGNSDVMWDGNFGFDVILLEERSEPKWT